MRRFAEGMEERGWAAGSVPRWCGRYWAPNSPTRWPLLRFAAGGRAPLARTTDEIGHILRALDGGYVPAGPSGSPTRGLVQRAADRTELLFRRPQGDPLRG
ncbi:hypothetical protein GCM10023238_01780 [Streptomyces heliomycini]